jgi:mannose-6-phosphate isomerase-like protein (cupin superfamily)
MIERKKTLNVFKDARGAWGSYDDFPVGPPGTDPMPHLSRNRCAQPFYLVSEADQVLIQMAGRGEIRFLDERMTLEPGDTVYIPACVPSRLVPDGENVQLRLKSEPAVREAVAWYCECGALVHTIEITGIVQEGYLAAVHAFNASARTCPSCQRIHPLAELGDIAWADTAAALRSL